MKSFLLSFTFIIAFLFTAASKDQKNEEKFKIEVRGKVAAVNTSKIVPAKVAIRAPGIALTLDTDSEGKFSTTFAAVSAFTVTVQSPGYEKLEQTLSIAHLNADSTIQITFNRPLKCRFYYSNLCEPNAHRKDQATWNDLRQENFEADKSRV